ncbi:testis-specific serine kinase substrate [Rhinatrema bivittatum]|uniref:testis-specific serine kinase substrate n=1 Tax=Rhinatrema bivittatum TaxID=194408 RepID=UPI001126E92F|nr:testis-specific serine kinase substrate [Rhinatrema bivittatum]
MTPVVFKTIWQCQEINQIGDQPCTDTKLLPEVPLTAEQQPKMEKLRMFVRRKKAVSFHGVETGKADDCMQWRLQLKRSSACTNVSVLNLAEVDNETTESETTEDGSGSASENLGALLQPESEEEFAMETDFSKCLMKAKDSITDLTKRSADLSEHVKNLESECAALCENLELRHQEAEELETYYRKLEKTCQKVKKSVEDAEKKVSTLRESAQVLEERLNSLQEEVVVRQQLFAKYESQQKELEKMAAVAARTARRSMAAAFSPAELAGAMASAEDTWTRVLSKAVDLMLTSTAGLQHSAETQKTWQSMEAGTPAAEESKTVKSSLHPVREELGEPEGNQQEILSHKELLRMVTHMCSRFDLFLPQWEQAQKEQALIAQSIQELQSNTDSVTTIMKRISCSFSQLQKDVESLWQMKPLTEEISRQLSGTKNLDLAEHAGLGRTGCPSPSGSTTENLKQTMDQALVPVLEEIKLFNQRSTCTNCQRLQKKILELERQALEAHMQMVVLRSDLRVVHDDALRLQNLLSRQRLKNEEKMDLEDIYLKMCSMQEQLCKLSAEEPTLVKETEETLERRRPCPDGNVQNSSSLSLN